MGNFNALVSSYLDACLSWNLKPESDSNDLTKFLENHPDLRAEKARFRRTRYISQSRRPRVKGG